MIGSSQNNREYYPRKSFRRQEKETQVKFNPGLSVNRPSNNWAQGSYNQCFLEPGVLTTKGLTTSGLTTRGSYNQWSYNQGFLHPGVLQPGILTTRDLTTRDSYIQES